MTKVKLKDATKELATGAGAVLSDATRVRKSADALMQSLRKLEVKFTREEEERVAREKREEQEKLLYLRKVFSSLLITGPFSIVLGFEGGLMALNDRLKLRSMVVGEKGDRVYIASEEAAIRAMEPDAENIYAPAGGEPVIVRVKEGKF